MKRLALVLLSLGMFLGMGLFAASASAQANDCVLPDIADFVDADTGDIDVDAYTVALQAAQAACEPDVDADVVAAGTLARTGSSSGEMVAAGFALLLVGGGIVLATRSRVGAEA